MTGKTLLLHAGVGKTATSTIQSDLVTNARLLDRLGICFPQVQRGKRRFNGNMSAITTTLFSDRALFLEENIADGCDTPDRLEKRRDDYRNQLISQIEGSSHDTFLISSEAITNYDPVTFGRLFDWLDGLFDEIRTIACLRHPAEILASDIQQRVKVGFVVEQVLAGRPVLSYDRLLANLRDRSDDVICYDFADAIDEGVTQRFLRACGIASTDFRTRDSKDNESLSQLATELMSALNAKRPLKVEGAWGEGRFLEDRFFYFAIPGSPFRVSNAELERLAPIIDHQLDWIESEFGVRLRRTSERDLGRASKLDEDEAQHLALATSDLLLRVRELEEELASSRSERDAAQSELADISRAHRDLLAKREGARAGRRKRRFWR